MILSIDPSTNGCAITVLDKRKDGYYEIVDYRLTTMIKKIHNLNTFKIRLKNKNFYENIKEIINSIEDLLDLYQLKKIHIEDYSFGSCGNYLFQIGELCGCIKYYFINKGIEVETIPITHWKKNVIGKGNADKRTIQNVIDNIYRKDIKNFFSFYNDNLYDSLCIGLYKLMTEGDKNV